MKITPDVVNWVQQLSKEGMSQRKIAKEVGLSRVSVGEILSGAAMNRPRYKDNQNGTKIDCVGSYDNHYHNYISEVDPHRCDGCRNLIKTRKCNICRVRNHDSGQQVRQTA